MKRVTKGKRKSVRSKGKKKSAPKGASGAGDKGQDVRKLVHLLQVNQVELEHQNQELRLQKRSSKHRGINTSICLIIRRSRTSLWM
jgi:hypothetical protein